MTVTLTAVRDLWTRRLGTNDPADTVTTLRSWTVRDQGAATAVAHLVNTLTDVPGSLTEAAAWYQVLASWPTGFPPDRALTPLDRYPFDPTTGPASAIRFDPQTGRPLP